jgi:DNA-binding NarL/FixJ family response regulator
MPAMATRSVHLVEAQALFVDELAEVLAEAGLDLRGVTSDLEPRALSDDPPDVLFVDTDYLEDDPLRQINVVGALAPNTLVCVYTGEEDPEWADSCHFAGAAAIFSKHAPRGEIVAGLRTTLVDRRYTDRRLKPED